MNTGPVISGDMKDYQHAKNGSQGKWDGVNNINKDCFPQFTNKSMLTKKMSQRLMENKVTSRTITPTMNTKENRPQSNNTPIRQAKKMIYEGSYKLNSCSTIADLIAKTPDNEQTYKKYSERLLAGNNIFTPEITQYTKGKATIQLDQMKRSADYAGIKYWPMDEVKYFNETNHRTRKMQSATISINASFDKSFGHYEVKDNNKSSINHSFERTADKTKSQSDFKSINARVESAPKFKTNTYKRYLDNLNVNGKNSRTSKASTNATSFVMNRSKKE